MTPSITSNPDFLDTDFIVRSVQGSYWGGGYTREQILAALDESIVVGAYARDYLSCPTCCGHGSVRRQNQEKYEMCPPCGGSGRVLTDHQIGFVRIVSDTAIFSSITDVFVDEAYRGKGVGSAMIDYAVKLPEVAKTLCILQARPLAMLWYMKWDFVVVDHKSGIMQRSPT